MLADLRPREEGPVTIVFGMFGWRHTIVRWAEHARRAGCSHYRIVCMDDGIAEFLRERGEAHRAVALHDLVPDAPRVDFDAMDRRARMQALTPLRVKVFVRLAATGCDFIHSDADAFWLRDPRPWLSARPDHDLICSQGTTFPRAHYHRHHFVLCAGFFFCRANERTRAYFEQVSTLAERYLDDQVGMNASLLADPAGRWHLVRPVPAVRWKSEWIRPPLESFFRRCALYVLRRPVLRALTNLTLRLAKRDWIFTSPVTIDGRFAGGLRVGIIPMHIVARGRFRGWGEPLVFHSSENKSTSRPADGAVDQFRHPAIIIPRNPAPCRGRYHARRSHAADDERSADDPRSIQTDGASTGFELIHYPGIAELRRTV